MSRFAAFLVLVVSFLAAAPAAVAEKRSFKAWSAFCSQGFCVAETKTAGGRVRLQFRRSGESDAPWVIAFTDVQRDIAQGTPVSVTVDGDAPMSFAPQTGYQSRSNRLDLTDPVLLPILLPALRGGTTATLGFTHNQGFPLRLKFPLAGLAASILWIDEQQGRAGEQPVAAAPATPATPAPAPPAPLPPVPAAPGAQEQADNAPPEASKPVTLPIPAAVRERHLADGECRDFDADHMKSARITDRLDKDHTLYLLPCYTGAYNVVYRAWIVNAQAPREVQRQLFVGFTDRLGWYGKDTLINADFNAATKTLTAFEKGRGLGDCGSEPTYRWHEGFWRLLQMRNWDKCDGSRMPAQWPVIYQHPDYDGR